uniref:Uncharacterized protein n=1 Tax=Aegilops tauschii subsp. strangulata TaxID=200361 RepID=A0A453RHK0_AEGTS
MSGHGGKRSWYHAHTIPRDSCSFYTASMYIYISAPYRTCIPFVFPLTGQVCCMQKQDALNRLSVVTATCSTLPSFSLIHLVLLLRLSYLCSQRLFSLSLATIISPQVVPLPLIRRPECSAMPGTWSISDNRPREAFLQL